MADYAEALSAPRPRREKNMLRGIMLRKAENGGVVAEHHMSRFDGDHPVHAFGADQGPNLAAHIEKHIGIPMGGVRKPTPGTEEEREAEESE